MTRAALLALFASSVAFAGEPVRSDRGPVEVAVEDDSIDPAVDAAGESNLESIERRRGFTFAIALGGGLTVSIGHDPPIGRGGAGSIRFGQVATKHTVFIFELAGSALFHAVKAADGSMSSLHTNQGSSLLAGAQYFLGPTLWIRGGLGFGVYQGDDVLLDDDTRGDITRIGASATLGAGLAIVQFRRTSIGVELFSHAMVNRDGVITSNALLFNFAVD